MEFKHTFLKISDTQNIIFEKMAEKHIQQIAQVEAECFDDAWSYGLFYNELLDENKHYFVAIDENVVVGYGGYAQVLDEAHIMNIAVKGLYRNKGIGKEILNLIIDDAINRNIRAITLEVREGNDSAVALYEKKGFECAGLRKKYYNNTHNALIYWKEL